MKCAVQNGNRGTLLPTVMVYLHWFKKYAGLNKFKYVVNDCVWVDVDAIISIVSLQYESSSKIYMLDEVDANSLNEFILNHN
jgi:hypothetical protein